MLQRCSCNENPACTSKDEEDEDPGSPRGLPPGGGWMSPGPGGTHGGSHLWGRLGKVTIFTQSLLSSGSGKEGGKHLYYLPSAEGPPPVSLHPPLSKA